MLLLILLVLFFAIFAVAAYVCDKHGKEFLLGISTFVALCCLVGTIAVTTLTLCASDTANQFIKDKSFHDEILSVAVASDSISADTIKELVKNVERDNETILKHRKYDGNVFVGRMYRKEVAELELTQLPEVQVKFSKE